jgi:5-methylcytosine-specific restriction protein A
MTLEDQFTIALEEAYRRTGEEVGYWATRFIRAVRSNGGVDQARKMLKPRTKSQRAGLDALLNANRPDLTLESIVLESRFKKLFSKSERAIAKQRLQVYYDETARIKATRERLFPDELDPGVKYVEGAKKTVRVNAFERNAKARRACIAKHGLRCVVCNFDFEEFYGELGVGFIHVHHIRPIALTKGNSKVDPEKDLKPVCPNCHAMLHRKENVITINQLKSLLKAKTLKH